MRFASERACVLASRLPRPPRALASAGTAAEPHTPVLLPQVLDCFAGRPLQCYVDATLGAGGHASAVLAAHPARSPPALSVSASFS
jgi:16S rRNA (cytosine1402-N4)-methyltransferase